MTTLIRSLVICLLCLFCWGRAWLPLAAGEALHATQTLALAAEGLRVSIEVPAGWVQPSEVAADSRLAQSDDRAAAGTRALWMQLRRPEALSFGAIPPDDRVGTVLELLAASLPITGDYRPQFRSEVARVAWGDYPAAAFLAYSAASDGQPAYFAQWLGLELRPDLLLLLEFRALLPANTRPGIDQLNEFSLLRDSLRVNGEGLDATALEARLGQLRDPIDAAAPAVVALHVPGLELRLAAPEGWFRQDVSRSPNFPTQYLFEDDPQQLNEGQNPPGAVVQVSLISPRRIEERLLPPPPDAELPTAYAMQLLQSSRVRFESMQGAAFQWGEYPAYKVALRYANGFHSGDTYQEVLLLAVEGNLLMLVLYAPYLRQGEALAQWQAMLDALLINGEALPPGVLATLRLQALP